MQSLIPRIPFSNVGFTPPGRRRRVHMFAFDPPSEDQKAVVKNIIIEELPKALQPIKEGLSRINGRLDKMDGRLDKMDGRLDKMDGRLDKMDGRLDKMDGRLDKMDDRLDKVDGKLQQLTLDVQEIKISSAKDLQEIKSSSAKDMQIINQRMLIYFLISLGAIPLLTMGMQVLLPLLVKALP